MRVVLHTSTGDEAGQRAALANAGNLLGDDTISLDALAFVTNGEGVRMLVEGSPVADVVAELSDRIAFSACGASLRGRDIATGDLLPGVEPTASGVGAIAAMQEEGYRYIRVP
jgi:hypothetical protein